MRILVLYTGGTIGMKVDPKSHALIPFNFSHIEEEVPELKKFGFTINALSLNPIDSSDIQPPFWLELALLVQKNYHQYDGFVILHGTDTMAYSASMLSFMFENLSKPVIFTGSQLPIGMLRTDGKENLITAIEIAAAQKDGKVRVPEVCIYFENKLLRGNRTTKISAEHFNAFASFNYPSLAEVGIHIQYNDAAIHKSEFSVKEMLIVHSNLNTNVVSLKLFPGITAGTVKAILSVPEVRIVILETFGAGNAPSEKWFLDLISTAIADGILILNITQCPIGKVDMDKYKTGKQLKQLGVLSGYDISYEACISKCFYLLGKYHDTNDIRKLLNKSIRGEILT